MCDMGKQRWILVTDRNDCSLLKMRWAEVAAVLRESLSSDESGFLVLVDKLQ